MLLGDILASPGKATLLPFCQQLPLQQAALAVLSDLGNTPSSAKEIKSKSGTRPGYAHPLGSLHTSPYLSVLSAFCICFITKTQSPGRGVRRGLSKKPANPKHLLTLGWDLLTVKQESCTARTSLQLQKVLSQVVSRVIQGLACSCFCSDSMLRGVWLTVSCSFA